MNVGDTEVGRPDAAEGYVYTEDIGQADVILINTCSIRDNAEQRIWGRLAEMKRYRRAKQTGARRGHHRLHGRTPQGEIGRGPHGVDVVPGRMPTATCRAWCAKPKRAARA